MSHSLFTPIMLLAALGFAVEQPVAPVAELADAASPALTQAWPSAAFTASGTFTQTAITSLQSKAAGRTTILRQTSKGTVTGTLNGEFTDSLRVVIRPNGRFTAKFTLTCDCTMNGQQGILTLEAVDVGRLINPTLASFAGLAVITNGTGALSNLRGVLAIEGTIDLTTGLATYSYSGVVHSTP